MRSQVPAKLTLLGRQRVTVRAWRDVCRVWPGPADREQQLHELALAVLKPEAIACRVGPSLLDAMARHGFTTVGHARIRLDARTTTQLWRYHFAGAPPDRQRFIIRVMTAGESLLLLLRRTAPGRDPVPASTSLTVLKGPTARNRRPWHLRAGLPVHRTGLLSCLHTADEPLDVVRELGLLLDAPTRRRLLVDVDRGRDGSASAVAQLHAMHAETEQADLDGTQARRRVADALAQASGPGTRDLAALLSLAERHQPGPWEELLEVAAGCRLQAGLWDLLTVAADLVSPRLDIPEPFPVATELAARWQRVGPVPVPLPNRRTEPALSLQEVVDV